jgi:hypothetical protein
MAGLGGFWPGVACVYVGFFLLAVDAWFEPDFSRILRIAISTVMVLGAVAFSKFIVFVDAPLNLSALVTDATYPPGVKIEGVDWDSSFTKLQVHINNPTDRNYENLDLLLRPLSPIAHISQTSHVTNCFFSDRDSVSLEQVVMNLGTRKKTPTGLVLLATDAGYKIHCQTLPAKTTLTVLIALADIKWDPQKDYSGRPPEETFQDADYVLRYQKPDGTYWFGHPKSGVYRRSGNSQSLKISGSYDVTLRKREISEDTKIIGWLGQ